MSDEITILIGSNMWDKKDVMTIVVSDGKHNVYLQGKRDMYGTPFPAIRLDKAAARSLFQEVLQLLDKEATDE